MVRELLQDMVDDLPFDGLPVNWTAFDLVTFSTKKTLWDYQQKAVERAIKMLWKYYDNCVDYQTGERPEVNQERKRRVYEWYRVNGLEKNLDIELKNNTIKNRAIISLLEGYYQSQKEELRTYQRTILEYENFINRMSFWMATGSGKSLVLIKLIEVLRDLIQRGEVPPHDILVLTHRDDLIDQLKVHVDEFNAARSDIFIKLRELKEYADAKWEHPSLFKEQELTVFYYRSDNLSDEQKVKIVDFKNYDDQGQWYVLLDEAHKGGREESKRQQIYSILSRNGFLFNFSATFTDDRDRITTVSNFNLSEFIKTGYGKHIAILKQEIRAFRGDEDYNDEEKQKVVLKSLMMLAYASKFYEDIRTVRADLYHKPLLLTLVHSVNTQEADLKLFFRELERIGKGAISDDVWQQAKDELWNEFKERLSLMFEGDRRIEIDQQVFESLSKGDILKHVYNSSSSGEIEILVRPSDRKELVFKLKTSDRPFALIKIGDISGWLKEELAGYEVNERFEDESYFERLNEDDSEINILMGSRSFYEGWDSNRPNVINFVNIGTGTNAKKFILQSVGRGVRIEPFKDKRKRLLRLYNANEVEEDLFHQIKDKVLPIETLFIFGTNRSALHTVIKQLDQEKEKYKQLPLFAISEEAKKHKLLIPTYKKADYTRAGQRKLAKFEITRSEFDLLKRYVEFIGDDRVLLAMYETEPEKVRILRRSLSNHDDYYKHDGRSFKNIDLLVRRILDYFSVIPEEFERLKELEEEIRHFKSIKVSLKDISQLQSIIEQVRNFPYKKQKLEAELSKMSPEARRAVEEMLLKEARQTYEHDGKKVNIKYVANHYYIPIVLSEDEKVDYIKHIIKIPSEVRFVNDLERYLQREGNCFKEFDWWLFSKLDESLDQVYIPYYDPKTNRIRPFYPDFIFWLQKGDAYSIVFIDPKSPEYTGHERKLDGYKTIFEEDGNGRRVLDHEGLKVRVFTFLYTDDVNMLAQGYRKYWSDNIGKALAKVLEDPRSE